MAILIDLLRSVFIFCHLVIFGLAISTVILSDIRILRGKLDPGDIAHIGRVATRLFIGLWVTGLTIIYMDTGFDVDLLVGNPKLLLKLVCVLMLTVNALVLHHYCFKVLASDSPITLRKARILSICGAISSSHWFLATYVGCARMLNSFAFNVLFFIYSAFLILIVLVALLTAPFLKNLLNLHKAHRALATIGINRSSQGRTIKISPS